MDVKALLESTHEGKAYTLTGPEALSYDELATELSKALGRRITSDIKQVTGRDPGRFADYARDFAPSLVGLH